MEGLRGHWYTEGGPDEPLAGLSPRSFWLTLPSLLGRLEANGYGRVEIIDFPEHPNGPLVTLAGTLTHRPSSANTGAVTDPRRGSRRKWATSRAASSRAYARLRGIPLRMRRGS